MINSPSHLQLSADMLCKAINDLTRRVDDEIIADNMNAALALLAHKKRLHEIVAEIGVIAKFVEEK